MFSLSTTYLTGTLMQPHPRPESAATSKSDLQTVDVAVIGGGLAGLCAALTAAEAGATVLLAEASGQWGGNAIFATGNMALAGTRLQRDQGVLDSPDALVDDMIREVQSQGEYRPDFDVGLATVLAQAGGETFEFLSRLGIRFRGLVSRPRQHTNDRLVSVADPYEFATVLAPAAESLGVRMHPRSRVQRLLNTTDGVDGAILDERNGTIDVHARAVIIAAGGYAANPALRRKYRPDLDPRSSFPGIDTARGDAVLMAQAIGASLKNMAMIVPIIRANAHVIRDSIAINSDGRRYNDETAHHDQRISALRAQPGGMGYFLFDARHAAQDGRDIRDVPSAARAFESIDAVARAIGCAPAVLTETVGRWNETVHSDAAADPDFDRIIFPSPRVGIEQAPFTVLPIVTGIASTIGGIDVDTSMRALDKSGEPIKGLYAAGDAVGTINAVTGLGGIHLANAATSGRIAGREAASYRSHGQA
jgi:succinate dehydrogenase/fumarate reductase flavoprotein subunit